MQLSIKDIRAGGNNKIALGLDMHKFIQELSIHIRHKHISVYSIPKLYIEGSLQASKGMKRVLKYCEPMIDAGVSNTESLQRKFRNTWNSIWNNFALDTNLSDKYYDILRQASVSPLPEDLEDKLDTIIFWYLISGSETSLRDVGLNVESALNSLISFDNYNFTIRFLGHLKNTTDGFRTNSLG